jgi:hypothetical protein
MMDMMTMVQELRTRFGDEMMYMAWANQVQSNSTQMFNLEQQEGMDWTNLTQNDADDPAL